jgi:single-stranded DNA-binding protein
MESFCGDTERAMKRNKITGREVVYTKVVAWGKTNQDTWQVFLLRT